MAVKTAHSADAYAAFRSAGYRRYALGYFVSATGRQMLSVAVGYELYQKTHSATALGLVGLAGALPVILLALPAGYVADRYNRKTILLVTSAISVLSSMALTWLATAQTRVLSWPGLATAARWLEAFAGFFGEKEGVVFPPAVPLMLAILLISGCAKAFGWAARGAYTANLVPRRLLANAVTWNSSTFQFSSVIGPDWEVS